jgi:LacI family transcriptional regulator
VVCFVDEPQLAAASQVKAERIAGYRDALGSTKLELTGEVCFWECESSVAGGREAAEKILDDAPHTTAVVAMSDVIALGLLEYFAERGVSVPADVTVVGFDDIPEARLVRPQLTTVSQQGFEKGHHAADMLMRLISKDQVDSHVVLETQLVVRESSGVPAQPGS